MKSQNVSRWTIDKAHSEVQFKVKHLVISTVTGQFTDFVASLEMEGEDLRNAKAAFTANVASISTNNRDRDNHLKSADFFDAENHPEITFKSSGFESTDSGMFKMTGDLTIRGITRKVALDVEPGGTMVDPYGNTKVGYEITGKINRFDYNLHWNAVTEAGGVVVGPEVRLLMNIQFVRNKK